jgi:hypothetical protein
MTRANGKTRRMQTGEVIAWTLGLAFVAALTAGLWLNLILWIPMLILGRMKDQETAFGIVQFTAMVVAALTVFLVGLLAIGLPWYAAAIAGVLVGMTSYARPNPAADDLRY